MARLPRFGLRAQIVASLSIVFVVSFALLGTAAVRLSQAATTAGARAPLPLADLLQFYVSITGLAVLVLTYIALTYLIVRPLDRLTRGSAMLAAGSATVRVPEDGALEVARLAATFNEMAAQLRAERDALQARLVELEQATRDLKDAQEQLIHGEKLASVGRLAAGVAHEIGNPLAAILGLLELLQQGGLSPEQATEFLGRIHKETERINGIIRDLLDFSRRDHEREAVTESTELVTVVEDAVNLVRLQKAAKAIEISVQVETDLGPVLASQARLTQVVLNLLLNALDAVQGDGSVRIEARRNAEGHAALCVTDDGPGIASHMLDRLFEPFATTKPPGQGTGLGLAVCHTLVEAMGGRIRAENLPERGARFEVQLRLAKARPSQVPPPL